VNAVFLTLGKVLIPNPADKEYPDIALGGVATGRHEA
jgi:hypothetical protein